MMLTIVSNKQTMKANVLLYFRFGGVLYSHLELRFNPELKMNIEIS